MDKRYQVFISSTFADLEEERKGIMEAIIELDCFPAGMEMFPATDTEQFEYIKTVIDESDYYVLVIAGRYGTVAEDGISFTEKEFEYAREKNIPVLVFVKKDINTIAADKTDQDPNLKQKLEKFRKRALKRRMGTFWDSADELKYKIHSSLSKEFKMQPRKGWIRGDELSNQEVHEKMERLKNENSGLKSKLLKFEEERVLENKEEATTLDIDFKIEKMFEIFFGIVGSDGEQFHDELCIKDILDATGLELMWTISDEDFSDRINRRIIDPLAEKMCGKEVEAYITDASLEEIEKKLLALELVDIQPGTDFKILSFTKKGKQVFLKTVEI